jgi:hypothetical protein
MIEKMMAVIIGDVVGSREHSPRRALQDEIEATLGRVNDRLSPAQPIRTTIGDEFQGAFEHLHDAATASLLIRLELLSRPAEAETRFGLAWGEVDMFDADRPTPSQDGEAWWAAREAITRAKELQQHARTKFVSACFGHSRSAPWSGAVNAYLGLRDALIWGMSPRQRVLMMHMATGSTLNEAAEREGISPSGAFQALDRSGGFAVLDAAKRFAGQEFR